MSAAADSGFIIVNNQPKTCEEIHAECRKFADASPKRAIFECQTCGEQFRREDDE